MANPIQVNRLVEKVKKALPDVALSLHLHDTRGLGIVNMLAGYETGVEIFDVSSGGLGGCPFVKDASGNVALEDAVNLFEQMGIDTGVDLQAACRVAWQYESLLGKTLPGKMSQVLKSQRGSIQ
jgi:hydroxymethylglutaryl-CoA lyase